MKKVIFLILLALWCNGADLGAISPKEGLEFLKNNPNAVIIDAAAARWYNSKTFDGAINIPTEELSQNELDEKLKALPKDTPILLHCRAGVVVVPAYKRLKIVRPDITNWPTSMEDRRLMSIMRGKNQTKLRITSTLFLCQPFLYHQTYPDTQDNI